MVIFFCYKIKIANLMFLRAVSVAASPHHEVAHRNIILLDILQVVVMPGEVAAVTGTHQVRESTAVSVHDILHISVK